MYIPENIRKKDVYFIHDSIKDPQQWWVELMMIKDLLLSASVESVSFVLPNMLYSRQDRKDRPHVPISARALSKSPKAKCRVPMFSRMVLMPHLSSNLTFNSWLWT